MTKQCPVYEDSEIMNFVYYVPEGTRELWAKVRGHYGQMFRDPYGIVPIEVDSLDEVYSLRTVFWKNPNFSAMRVNYTCDSREKKVELEHDIVVNKPLKLLKRKTDESATA